MNATIISHPSSSFCPFSDSRRSKDWFAFVEATKARFGLLPEYTQVYAWVKDKDEKRTAAAQAAIQKDIGMLIAQLREENDFLRYKEWWKKRE